MSRIYYGYWIVVAGFFTQFVAVGMANYVVGAFLIPMTEEFAWTRAEFTASRSIGQLVFAITGFLIGAQIDRFGGRPFIIAGSLVLALSMVSLGSISSLEQWLFINGLLLTTGSAMIGNLSVNVTLGKWFVEKRGKAVALAGMGISLAGIVLPPVATLLVDTFGWRQSWRMLGGISLLMTLPAAFAVRRRPEDYGHHPDGHSVEDVAAGRGAAAQRDYENSMTRAQAMRTVSFYLLVLAFGLFQISITVMLTQTIPLMTDAGYSRLVASSMISLASVPAFLSKPFWGIMIDRYDPKSLQAWRRHHRHVHNLYCMEHRVQQLMSGCMLLFAYGDRLGWLVASARGYLGLGVWQALSGIGSLHCDAVYLECRRLVRFWWPVITIWLAVMISPCWSLRLAISPLHSCCIS